MSDALAVTDATFEQEVVKASLPVLVDFWAEWCQPCKRIAPIVDQVAADQATRLSVAKVDVDAYPDLATRFGVQSIPTLILFKAGEPVERLVGFVNKEQLVRKLTPHL